MSEVVPSRTDQGNITKFLITSNKNKKKRDITGSIVDLYYQESIFDTSVRLQISVSDAGYKEIDKKTGLGKGKSQNFIEELNLAGGEKAEIAFEDSCDRTRRLTMYVNTITPFKESTTDLAAMISFVSKEYLDNEQTAIRKRFTGKISETIQKIVSTTPTAQGKNGLGSKKKVDVEDTVNEWAFIGNGRKPFYWCVNLAKRAIPGATKTKTKQTTVENYDNKSQYNPSAGYLFFENHSGFIFKSIESLFNSDYKKKFIASDTSNRPENYDAKILKFSFLKTIDFQNDLMNGVYNNEATFFDPYTNESNERKLTSKDLSKQVQHTGKEPSTTLVNQEFCKYPSRWYMQSLDIGSMPPGKDLNEQIEKCKVQNIRYPDITAQAVMRYHQMMTIQMSMTTGGVFDIEVGDQIFCELPEAAASTGTKEGSKKNSGIYMVAELCHHLNPQGSYSKFIVVRDSFGRKGK